MHLGEHQNAFNVIVFLIFKVSFLYKKKVHNNNNNNNNTRAFRCILRLLHFYYKDYGSESSKAC